MGLVTNQIIAVSRDEWAHIAAWPLCRSKLSLVHNGIRTRMTPSVEADSAPSQYRKLLFVGRLSNQKNPLYTVDIMKHLPDFQLTIVGDGEYFAQMQAKIAKEQLTDQVHMAGFQDNVEPYYLKHQAVILSSLYEGFPYVVLEAMANGCIIIGTDVPGLKGVIEETGNIRIPLDQPAAAAAYIEERLEDKDAMQQLRITNRKLVRDKYTVTRMSDELEQIYDSLLKRKELAAAWRLSGRKR